MTAEIDDVAATLASSLEGGGELIDAGGFSIDIDQARTKLRLFQIADPFAYVLVLIEVAVLTGATPVEIRTDDGITIELGQLAISRAELEQLSLAAFIDLRDLDPAESVRRRALQKLAIAATAALRLEPRLLEIELVEADEVVVLVLDADHERVEVSPRTHQPLGVRVRLRHGLGTVAREPTLIRERCRESEIEIHVDGERVSLGHARALHVDLGLDHELDLLFRSNARRVRRLELDGVAIGRCGLRFNSEAPAELRILTNGVFAERIELDDDPRPALPGFAAVVELDLPKDLGQTQVLRGPEFERVMAVVRAVHDRIAPPPSRDRIVDPRPVPTPAEPVSEPASGFSQALALFVVVMVGTITISIAAALGELTPAKTALVLVLSGLVTAGIVTAVIVARNKLEP